MMRDMKIKLCKAETRLHPGFSLIILCVFNGKKGLFGGGGLSSGLKIRTAGDKNLLLSDPEHTHPSAKDIGYACIFLHRCGYLF